jgi:site-specific recombinase XerD
MDRKPVRGAQARDPGRGHRKKAPAGFRVVSRGSILYVMGTVRAAGRSRRVRRSTDLSDTAQGRSDAEALRDRWATEIRDELVHGIKPSTALAIAARDYLKRPRKRPLNAFDVKVIQELTKRFGPRRLNAIPDGEWIRFLDDRQKGNKPQTRERYLDTVCAFLTWCMAPTRAYIERLPAFERLAPKDRLSTVHERRRVAELRPELVVMLVENAAWHVVPQLAVEWTSGARVSSIVYGCRLCDVILAEGREQITFHDTKNGRSNTASLHPWAAEKLRAYLKRRGRLEDREGPLFLTDRNQPYADNGKASGGQNKTAFKAARSRTVKQLLRASVLARRAGDLEAAQQLRIDARLIRQVTQHWFRHLIATSMLGDGGDIKSLMEQAGWIDPRSALRYAHVVKPLQRAAVNRLPIGAVPQTKFDQPARVPTARTKNERGR